MTFQSTTQDVLTLLGPPSAVFEKEEDKMKIHARAYTGLGCADYFYNYFHLGVDFLFDVHTHVLKKIVLHTNIPGHRAFNQLKKKKEFWEKHCFKFSSNRYMKCNFRLIFLEHEKKPVIGPDTKWTEISKVLGGPTDKPVVNNQGSYINPFGPTLFYGYDQFRVVFEVIQKSYHIATVLLYSNR